MDKTECSEKSAYRIQTPGNYPEENIQHKEHGESLKSTALKMLKHLWLRRIIVQEFYFSRGSWNQTAAKSEVYV
jgi:hypothetical protein